MIRSAIRDHVFKHFLKVTEFGSAQVTVDPTPPSDFVTYPPFGGFLSNTAGSTEINTDGSTTSVDFAIRANTTNIFIENIVFKIVDASMDFSKFGGIAELPNGCDLIYKTSRGEQLIYSGIKTNADLAQATGDNRSLIIDNFKGAENGYLPKLDTDYYGYRYGLKLRAKSIDELILRVNDNLSGINEFNAYAVGRQII